MHLHSTQASADNMSASITLSPETHETKTTKPIIKDQSNFGKYNGHATSDSVTLADTTSVSVSVNSGATSGTASYGPVRSDIGRPCWDCENCVSGYIPHEFKKTCNSCKCPKDSHDLFHDELINIRDRLGAATKNTTDPFQRLSTLRPQPIHQGYTWTPPNLNSAQVGEYYSEYPPEKIPKSGTSGELYRDRQILHQIPKQDLALAYCKHVEKEHHSAYEDFVNARNEVALDVGFVAPVVIPATDCHVCGESIRVGHLGVFAPKFGRTFCTTCFRCNYCNEFLVDLTYCNFNDALYCERHYAEQIRPRCAACDEDMIFLVKKIDQLVSRPPYTNSCF